MTALVIAIFVASVLGSLHCAGMCGAFLAIAVGDTSVSRVRTQSAYHLGRLLTYTTLGAAAGALGKALDLAGALAGLRPIAAALAGLTIIAFGLISYARLKGITLPIPHLPGPFRALSARGFKFAMSRSVTTRAALIGLLTTLLPCGWLYAFVATAAGTASPTHGALAMAAFWAGTLPMMVALGAGLRELLGSLGQRLPALTCLLLVAMGLFTLTGRLNLIPARLMSVAAAHTTADSPAAIPTSQPACCIRKEGP